MEPAESNTSHFLDASAPDIEPQQTQPTNAFFYMHPHFPILYSQTPNTTNSEFLSTTEEDPEGTLYVIGSQHEAVDYEYKTLPHSNELMRLISNRASSKKAVHKIDESGQNGTNGRNGNRGTDGKPGARGADGRNGANTGQHGEDGQRGTDASPAANGSAGQNGEHGSHANNIQLFLENVSTNNSQMIRICPTNARHSTIATLNVETDLKDPNSCIIIRAKGLHF